MQRTDSSSPFSSPFSLPFPSSKRIYDVFLSFRAGDSAAKNFAYDLYEALKRQRLVVFRDDVDGGKTMVEKLQAIEESRSSIVVLSENYADSISMKELTKIVTCKTSMNRMVLPIFYQIDPANVRKQMGNFEMPFSRHEANDESDLEEVQKWRDSLNEVGNLSGWHLSNPQSETEVIEEVVKHVFNKLRPDLFIYDEKLVGIRSRAQQVNMLLGTGLDDVRFVGIWGMGGIGKTTIARVIYKSIAHEFDSCCFLNNVKEISKDVAGLVSLQETLLSGTLVKRNVQIGDGDGAAMIKRRLSNIRALIVIDDVDHLGQIRKLAGGNDWFGSGSRVIITTRDEHLLISHGIDRRYNVEGLNHGEALQLFSYKAFGENLPEKGYFDLSTQIVEYVGGLPLAIEVLGSYLRDRPMAAWENAVDKVKDVCDKDITEKLKISYNALDESDKRIFLDIACFFKGKNKHQVIEILQSFGFPAIIGLETLEEKSLISMSHNKIQMHDLIQEMGQDIVCRESPDPEKRSRLWLREDVNRALTQNQGTEAIEGIVMDLDEQGVSYLNAKSFSAMTNLRVLKISNIYLSGDLEYLSDELRLLSWRGYPLRCLPSNFFPKKLVELNLPNSSIEHLWKGAKCLERLKVVDLSDSPFLSKTPDFSGVPNLERLILCGCIQLFELHRSIGTLKHLIQLDLKDCKRLKRVHFPLSLESLNTLILSGCSMLENFPEIVGNMKSLSHVYLDGTAVRELHSSVEHLPGLIVLDVSNCKNLKKLPSTIGCLLSLRTFLLSGCSKLDRIPETLGNLACLEKLDISGTDLSQAPSSLQLLTNLKVFKCEGLSRKFCRSLFPVWNLRTSYSHSYGLKLVNCLYNFSSMRILNLSGCNLVDGDIPNNLWNLPSVQILDLSGNNFTSLPESLSELTNLRELTLINCSRLQRLPKLPLSVGKVHARDCVSLKEYYNQEKQMPSSSTGMTVVSCPITAELQNFKIDQIKLSSIHIRTMVQRYLEVLTSQQEKYLFTIPYPQLISCFDQKKYGSSNTVHCPPDTCDDNARAGLALSAYFEVENHENINPEISCDFIIHLETDECPPKSPLVFDRNENYLSPRRELLVLYIPFRLVSDWLGQSCCIDITITPTNPIVKVKACGVSLLYEQDAGQFIGKLIKALFGSPDFVHKLIVDHILNRQKRVNISSLLEGGTNYKTYWLNALQRTVGSSQRLHPSRESNAIQDFSSGTEEQRYESDTAIMLKRNLKLVLCRTFEELKLNGEYYSFPRRGISEKWFPLQVRRPSVTIGVPPNLHKNKKWMGLAFFAVFSVKENSKISPSFSYKVECDEYSLIRPSVIPLPEEFFNGFHQLCVMYEPRSVYPYRFNRWKHLRVSFLPNCSDTKAVLCGARLLYKHDLDGFVNTMIDSVLGCSPNLYEYYNKVFVEGMLSLIRSQRYDPKKMEEDEEEEEEEDNCLMELEIKQGSMKANHASTFSTSLVSGAANPNYFNDHFLDLKNSLRHFFQRSLQDRFDTAFDFVIPGCDVPQLFSRQRERNRATIQLPPTLYTNNDWIGFVVCGLLKVTKNPNAILNNPGSVISHDLMCQFGIKQGLIKPLHIHTITENKLLWLDEKKFIWLYYIPRRTYGNILRHCPDIYAIVEADSPELFVERCGIYLVHKQDREKIDQILMESISSTPSRSKG